MRATVARSNTLGRELVASRDRIGSRLANGLKTAGDIILAESLERAPRDTGALAESGHVFSKGTLLDTVVIVGYGRSDFPLEERWSPREQKMVVRKPWDYALHQHETHKEAMDYLKGAALQKVNEIKAAIVAAMRGLTWGARLKL